MKVFIFVFGEYPSTATQGHGLT